MHIQLSELGGSGAPTLLHIDKSSFNAEIQSKIWEKVQRSCQKELWLKVLHWISLQGRHGLQRRFSSSPPFGKEHLLVVAWLLDLHV